MSRKIEVAFEVRDMLIMKDTLKQMGIQFSEEGSGLRIATSYGITVTGTKMSYDDVDQVQVNKIKQQYQVNFWRDKAIKEGMQLHEEKTSNGEVILRLSH